MLTALQPTQAHGLRGDAIPSQDHRGDDLLIVISDPLGEGQALEQVGEAVGVEHHADEVRLFGLIAGDQLLGEHVPGSVLVGLQAGKPDARRVQLPAQLQQLGAFGVEVGLDASDLSLEPGDPGIELSQSAVISADCPREGRDPVLAGADLLRQRARVRGARRRRTRAQPEQNGGHHNEHDRDSEAAGEYCDCA